MFKFNQFLTISIILWVSLKVYYPKEAQFIVASNSIKMASSAYQYNVDSIIISDDVIIENYFEYLDSIVLKYDSLTPYKLSEHLLVRANVWIIDTLQHTDYYRMKAKDSFVYDQKKMIALPKNNLIIIPDANEAKKILYAFQNTTIDVNIPESKLRVYEDSTLLYQFPVRVGQNQEKYLEMSGRIQDLKTKTGEGRIVSHIRKPRYVNPVNNHEYFVTKRDDGELTKLPQIPFIETEINGLRYGQLIHPTTNPVTLEKAYSNGCIGTREADAWVIYYYAPIATKIKIRYDLTRVTSERDTIVFKDIYGINN
jgi:L,D-transpeptidase ErfK/SrfK